MLRFECANPLEVVKEMFWLAYQASFVVGMGLLQKRNDVTKEQVFDNLVNSADYPRRHNFAKDYYYADYVFGRMMKLGLTVEEGAISIKIEDVDPEYQSWGQKYPTYEALFLAANKNIND